MRKIFKYEISPGKTTVLTHANAKFLSVQVQRNIPCVWIEVDTNEDLVHYTYHIIPTGSEFTNDNKLNYLGTFQLDNGNLVFHVYIKEIE